MADPYRSRAYSNNNAQGTNSYPQGTRPNYLARNQSYDNGDDDEYFDGGTGVGRRQSIAQEQQYDLEEYYEQYSSQPTNNGRIMSERTQSPGTFFAVTPGGNANQNSAYRPPFSAAYPAPGQDTVESPAAPYPTGPGYNGAQNHSAPGHHPYNPAEYHPQRQATSAGNSNYTASNEYRPQRHATTGGGYPSAGGQSPYNPGAFNNTVPYPSGQGYPAIDRRPVPMPGGGAPQPHPAQAPFVGYSQYSNRPQYANTPHSYMSSSAQQYSPGFPPIPSQSAPPQSSYQPPPPPPPPHPPSSPGYNQTTYGGGASYNSNHYPPASSPGQSTLSHTSSQRTYLSRPETHYNSGSESDISGPEPEGITPHHPLPSPPKDRPLPLRDPKYQNYQGQPLPSLPPPAPPSHRMISRERSDSRPLPRVPTAAMDNGESADGLYADVEAELMGMGSGPLSSPQIHLNEPIEGPANGNYRQSVNGANGRLDPVVADLYDYYSNSSDAEAAAGLEAMRVDEQREVEKSKRESSNSLPPAHNDEDDEDLDYAMADMGGLIGFYGPDTSYGHDNTIPIKGNALPSPPAQSVSRQNSGAAAVRTPNPNQFAIPDEQDVHPFPEFATNARVDTWGTGGNLNPSEAQKVRRLSFDEGDDLDRSHSQSPVKRSDSDDDIPELFYHPPATSSSTASPMASRPLPSPPYNQFASELRPAGTSPQLPYPDSGHHRNGSLGGRSPTFGGYPPQSPGIYSTMSLGSGTPVIPRATSLSSHPSTPQTLPPTRSKTDGRAHPKSNRTSMIAPDNGELSPGLTPSDLPVIPLTRKFDPKKLGRRDFEKCSAPWALSSISAWLKETTEGEQYLKEAAVADAVSALFTHNVPTMNVADAETLAAKIVSGMLKEKVLIKEEEWVKFGEGSVCGVVYQITGAGCYAPKLHEIECPGRCYAHHCSRTLKKIQLPQYGEEPKQKMEDWATFWELKKENIANAPKKEIERQNNLHEIVQTEEEYMEHLKILKLVYRDQILAANPAIIKPSKLDNFVKDVFGKAEAVRTVSEEHLLPQIKFRQREQGPWIRGFSDIFREWIRKAKTAYLDYATGFPRADMLVRREAERNLLFRQFLENCRNDPRARRLDWVTFLKGPITRLQRYSLLLSTVLKHTTQENEEKQNLERAIEEIKAVTLECDARVDEMSKRVQLLELGTKLIMRKWDVDLRLEEKGRELIFKGDLQRIGSNRFTWLETHVILFDHYLVLAKATMQKEVVGGAKHERYDVSRMPIPMDLLVLESTDDDPVVRGTASKLGISSPAATARPDGRTGRHNTMNTIPTLQHTNTSTSVASTATAPGRLVTNLPDQNAVNDKVLYPFRIKHLGNPGRYVKTEDSTYILYAPSAQNRKDWCDRIIVAKEKHAQSLHAQNAEPFRLKVIADAAFSYDSTMAAGPKPIKVRGTPLDRAISECEKAHEQEGPRPNPVCRAVVNCATTFSPQPGREMVAIGTDFGVFVANSNDARGWSRCIPVAKVTQIAVLEEFSLFLVLADKALIAYHLDVVIPPPGVPPPAKPKPPQKLSGAKDVGFMATSYMKDRTLVFYKKREGLSSIFKVLEPIKQKGTEKKSRFSRKSHTEYFGDFDEFYIPTDCYGINLFVSSLAIQTSKGFEVMTLDKKQPWSVPELRASHVADIAARLANQKPLGMFRLSDIEFLLCYEECAVYVNKHGEISRSVIMEFVGKARTAALYGPYVLIFDPDFVEVRNAQNGRLRQVISGRDVRCIDDGLYGGSAGGKSRTVKVACAHPEVDGRQLVFELCLNEGQKD
ncbi:CNH domain-containing protein [Geopyxis carbonaria]|nr:CNH domain-containing protein [Geopyxis carbonaria]